MKSKVKNPRNIERKKCEGAETFPLMLSVEELILDSCGISYIQEHTDIQEQSHIGLCSLTKHKFLQLKNSFATIVNRLSVMKLFQLSNGNLLFS